MIRIWGTEAERAAVCGQAAIDAREFPIAGNGLGKKDNVFDRSAWTNFI